jgi:ElaB/YqjD/DUF883 family membrane-anchored ribosome-binding protein
MPENAMPHNPSPEDLRNKPVSAVMDDIMHQSEAALQSGARATAELNELRRRADEALDWQTQLERHRWLALGLAAGASVLLFLLFSRKD